MLSEAHLTFFNTPEEGSGILQQQWLSLNAVHHPIFCAERVLNIWYFVCNLRVNLVRIGLVSTMRGLSMLPEAHPIIVMHPRKVMNHSCSNECLFLRHIIPFPMLRGHPKSGILHSIRWSTSVDRAWCESKLACICCHKLLQFFLLPLSSIVSTPEAMDISPESTI